MIKDTHRKPIASISLDLDDYWTYLKSNADEKWKEYPSYLDWVVPRILSFFNDFDTKITFFVVGKDLAKEKNFPVLRKIVENGHEIGNHSFSHDQWMAQFSIQKIEEEIIKAEELILELSGKKPQGYRGPGYSFSNDIAKILINRGYLYDGSKWPTFIGPLSYYYFLTKSNFKNLDKNKRSGLFGTWSDSFGSLRPFLWQYKNSSILEIPVTTMPMLKSPIHPTYILYLYKLNKSLALKYFKYALYLCKTSNITPSILFHCTDFIGKNDPVNLKFMPNMELDSETKIDFLRSVLSLMKTNFKISTMKEHAEVYYANANSFKTKMIVPHD